MNETTQSKRSRGIPTSEMQEFVATLVRLSEKMNESLAKLGDTVTLIDGWDSVYFGAEKIRKQFSKIIGEANLGVVKAISESSLSPNGSLSCGCLRNEMTSDRTRKHGHSAKQNRGKITSEFSAYLHAKQRCEDANCKCYFRYGGRGIQFRFSSFNEFLEVVGHKPSKIHSIERIDVNGHYEQGNVRWATPKEQANNTRKTLWITIDGVTKNLPQWLGYGTKQYYNARYQIRSLGRDPALVVKSLL